jgi:peptidoglycan hydrolase-like protein with peptidoglycan-binding domain
VSAGHVKRFAAGCLLLSAAIATHPRGLQAAGAATGATRTEAASVRANVYLLQGEGLKPVGRTLPTHSVAAAVTALLKGPTPAEAKLDVRTQVPSGTRLLKTSVSAGVATVDLSRPYVEGTNKASLIARLTQLVWTATAVPGVKGVRLWIDGKQASSLGQGVSVAGTLTRANVDPPKPQLLPPTTVVPDKTGPASAGGQSTKWIQLRLVALGYLPTSAVTGHLGPWTRSAVLAFQGWEKLTRDAVPGPQTTARLKTAKRPTPAPGSGKRIQVYLAAQVALLVNGNRVERVIKVSTGAPGFATPTGSYAVYRKHLKDWSYPYKVWLPYASYFVGGIAFHESPSVPAYPASHGCVRVPRDDAPGVYRFATLNTSVKVFP